MNMWVGPWKKTGRFATTAEDWRSTLIAAASDYALSPQNYFAIQYIDVKVGMQMIINIKKSFSWKQKSSHDFSCEVFHWILV